MALYNLAPKAGRGSKIILPVGTRFGRLVVLGLSDNLGPYHNAGAHLVKCDCGNTKSIITTQLIDGHTKSCGCLGLESSQKFLDSATAGMHSVFYDYQRHAFQRHLEFNLSEEQFIDLTSMPCYYCGKAPSSFRKSLRKSGGGFVYNGIDRIHNKLGYTVDNTISCCEFCNKMKMDHTQEEFIYQCRLIVEEADKKSGAL